MNHIVNIWFNYFRISPYVKQPSSYGKINYNESALCLRVYLYDNIIFYFSIRTIKVANPTWRWKQRVTFFFFMMKNRHAQCFDDHVKSRSTTFWFNPISTAIIFCSNSTAWTTQSEKKTVGLLYVHWVAYTVKIFVWK